MRRLRACICSVVIPVRDEAEHLGRTLDALADQTDWRKRPLDSDIYEIIVLANNCRDRSAQTARCWQRRNPQIKLHVAEISLPRAFANVGLVRRLLMDEACRRLKQNGPSGGIIATTDGDTCVAPDWIAATIQEIRRGADAVGGRILIEDCRKVSTGNLSTASVAAASANASTAIRFARRSEFRTAFGLLSTAANAAATAWESAINLFFIWRFLTIMRRAANRFKFAFSSFNFLLTAAQTFSANFHLN